MLILIVLRLGLLDVVGCLLLPNGSFLQNDIVEDVEVFQILRGVLLPLNDLLLFIVVQKYSTWWHAHIGRHRRLVLPVLVCLAS